MANEIMRGKIKNASLTDIFYTRKYYSPRELAKKINSTNLYVCSGMNRHSQYYGNQPVLGQGLNHSLIFNSQYAKKNDNLLVVM